MRKKQRHQKSHVGYHNEHHRLITTTRRIVIGLFLPIAAAFSSRHIYIPSTMKAPLLVSRPGSIGLPSLLVQKSSGMILPASNREAEFVKDDTSLPLRQEIDSLDKDSIAAATAFAGNLKAGRPKLIAFDKDGTLGDCTASLRRWIYHMRDRIRESIAKNRMTRQETEELLADFYLTMGWNVTKDNVLPSAPVAAGTWDDIISLLYQFLMTHKDQMEDHIIVTRALAEEWHEELGDLHGQDAPLVDDLRGMLLSCRELGYTVGICTSDDRKGTEMAMKAWNIEDLVDVSICGDEVSDGKPSAVPLQRLCALATAQLQQQQQQGGQVVYLPQDCIVVGDTSSDTKMARAAKAGFCVGVLTGSGTTEQLVETGAHMILPCVGHIPALLEALERLSEEHHPESQ